VRTAFFRTLVELASRDQRVCLVVGDLGFSVVEPFAEQFPGRFINAGVAEQNMVGLAAGLALSGKLVFTYSIGNFPVLRCLEQIRNDVCYHNANVKICAVGGGFAYGALGFSHHATEDLAVMRVMPNMTVVAPGDPVEAAHATRAIAETAGPCYLRLGRTGEPIVHASSVAFHLGQAILVQPGTDMTLITTGGMLHTAVTVAGRLAETGTRARVLSMHTLKPIDEAAVLAAAQETPLIVTVEEHSEVGGLGSAVAEVLTRATTLLRARFVALALPSGFSAYAGTQESLRAAHGLSVEAILERIMTLVAGSKRGTSAPAR